MPDCNEDLRLSVSRRELATILAALRFHQDENLQAGCGILYEFLREIATDGGQLKPLDCEEVGNLCERLNLDKGQPETGLLIDPPHKEGGDEPLFRVVYVIDLNAAGPVEAARQAHQIMANPESQGPVLQVISHDGKTMPIDLSQKAPA